MSVWRARWVICTLNNPSDDELSHLERLAKSVDLTAFCGQMEMGEEGTPHVQFCCRSDEQRRLKQWKALLGARVHIEKCMDPKASWDYCHKDSTRVANGWNLMVGRPDLDNLGKQPGKNMWLVFQDYVPNHTWDDCVDHFPHLIKDEGAMRKIFERAQKPHSEKKVLAFIGPPGVGKTYSAMEYIKENKLSYYQAVNGKWFEGWNYADALILNDFKSGIFTRAWFLQLTDPHQHGVRGEIKGGSVLLNPKVIIITSNHDPRTWFDAEEKDLPASIKGDAVMRRLTIFNISDIGAVSRGSGSPSLGNTGLGSVIRTKQTLLKMISSGNSAESKPAPDESPQRFGDGSEEIAESDQDARPPESPTFYRVEAIDGESDGDYDDRLERPARALKRTRAASDATLRKMVARAADVYN